MGNYSPEREESPIKEYLDPQFVVVMLVVSFFVRAVQASRHLNCPKLGLKALDEEHFCGLARSMLS